MDLFSEPVPTFNIAGKTSVQTRLGIFCSLLIFILTFAFSLLKLQHLIERKNPDLTTNTEPLEGGEKFFLESDEFMMAVSLIDAKFTPLQYDPNYFKLHTFVSTWSENA